MLAAVVAAAPYTTSLPRTNTWPNEDVMPSRASKTPAILARERGETPPDRPIIACELILLSPASDLGWSGAITTERQVSEPAASVWVMRRVQMPSVGWGPVSRWNGLARNTPDVLGKFRSRIGLISTRPRESHSKNKRARRNFSGPRLELL